jgi:dTDP-4-dehydrorhamnose reductase
MKILLLGKNGQVGWELQRALAPLGEVLALDRRSKSDGLCGDLSNLSGLATTIATLAPDVIVNAAAYTAVDKAESESEEAYLINARAVEVIARETAKLDALFVHYSTDYVFDGSGDQPWRETDTTAPLNQYGASKLAGEQSIQASECKSLILRTSWVYGARRNNFATSILRLAGERESLNVIDDQIGVPTGADLLADVVAHMIPLAIDNPQLCGLYHLCASGETSWHEYAQFVIDAARQEGIVLKAETVEPIATAAYPTIATRPLNSRLDTQKLQAAFPLRLPEWQQGVTRMLKEFLSK